MIIQQLKLFQIIILIQQMKSKIFILMTAMLLLISSAYDKTGVQLKIFNRYELFKTITLKQGQYFLSLNYKFIAAQRKEFNIVTTWNDEVIDKSFVSYYDPLSYSIKNVPIKAKEGENKLAGKIITTYRYWLPILQIDGTCRIDEVLPAIEKPQAQEKAPKYPIFPGDSWFAQFSVSNQNTLTNSDFELQDSGDQILSFTHISQWNSDHPSKVGKAKLFTNAFDPSDQVVELNSATLSYSDSIPKGIYQLSFEYVKNNAAFNKRTLGYFINNQKIKVLTSQNNTLLKEIAIIKLDDESNLLSFKNINEQSQLFNQDKYGIIIDNIELKAAQIGSIPPQNQQGPQFPLVADTYQIFPYQFDILGGSAITNGDFDTPMIDQNTAIFSEIPGWKAVDGQIVLGKGQKYTTYLDSWDSVLALNDAARIAYTGEVPEGLYILTFFYMKRALSASSRMAVFTNQMKTHQYQSSDQFLKVAAIFFMVTKITPIFEFQGLDAGKTGMVIDGVKLWPSSIIV